MTLDRDQISALLDIFEGIAAIHVPGQSARERRLIAIEKVIDALPSPVTPASDVVEALRLYDIYDRMPSDRGGKNGPRGKAYQAFVAAKDAALALPQPIGVLEALRVSEADMDIALRRLRMETYVTGAPSGIIRLIDDILLSCLPFGRLAEILTDAVAQRIEQSEPDEGRKDAGSTPVSILHDALFAALGEPDYKTARWSQGAEPWHYWSRESISGALEAALASLAPQGSEGGAKVVINPLEWPAINKRNHHTESSLGVYAIEDQGTHWSQDRFWLYVPHGVSGGNFNTLEEAKAAAQADYERRIRSALASPVQQDSGWRSMESAPKAFLVCNFHVARQPVKARGKFDPPTQYLYPADRENDARETAKIMRADLVPLYAMEGSDDDL